MKLNKSQKETNGKQIPGTWYICRETARARTQLHTPKEIKEEQRKKTKPRRAKEKHPAGPTVESLSCPPLGSLSCVCVLHVEPFFL